MKKNFLKLFVVSFVAAVLSLPAFASYTKYGIPDSAEVREEIVSTWFTAPLSDVRQKEAEFYSDGLGEGFQVRAEDRDGAVCIIVAPKTIYKMNYIKGTETVSENRYRYSESGSGSWILYRDAKSGKPLKVRWYFNADSDVYLEIRNSANKVYADMIVYNSYLARSVPLGISFNKLYTMSFDKIQNITSRSLPWYEVNVVPGQYHPVLQMVNVIRQLLPKMTIIDNVCYDQNEELWNIEDCVPYKAPTPQIQAVVDNALARGNFVMSGAGFLKWIADGVVKPFTGRTTNPVDLVEQTVYYNELGKKGVKDQKWHLSFSLDWCRNLAVAILNARSTKHNYEYTIGNIDSIGIDVAVQPFVFSQKTGSESRATGYVKDTGYPVDEVKAILYVLAVTEPQYAYFGAIKQNVGNDASDTVFNACAAFFPYFDDSGKFDCIVFADGNEYGLDKYLEAKANSYIHLDRIKTSDYFSPMF